MAASSSSSSSKKKKNAFVFSSAKNPNYSFPLSSDHPTNYYDNNLFDDVELDESDVVWGSSDNNQLPDMPFSSVVPKSSSSSSKKKRPMKERVVSASLPVNVPEYWSTVRPRHGGDEVILGLPENEIVPPHEYLARRRGDSFSVHEGMGRTLKGMELCRVRNEILKKLVGFED